MALVIPEICGKLEFPKIRGTGYQGKVYSLWYDKFILPYETPQQDFKDFKPFTINGRLLYLLRNAVFHEGSIDIKKDVSDELKLSPSQKFTFILNADVTSYSESKHSSSEDDLPDVKIRIGVRDLCKKLCAVGEAHYYEKLPDGSITNEIVKMDFNKYFSTISERED